MMASPRISQEKVSPKTKDLNSQTVSPAGASAISLSPKYTGRHSVLVALMKNELQLENPWEDEDILSESFSNDFDTTSIVKPSSSRSNFGDSGLKNSPNVSGRKTTTSVIYRSFNGSSVITDSSILEQELRDMETRKHDVSDSLLAFSLPEPFLASNSPYHRSSKKVTTVSDLYGPDDSHRSEVSELDVDESVFFIGEEPESYHRRSLMTNNEEDNSQTPSLYCDISVIRTSASDDQWAKYKLLGRVGMGEVRFRKAARKLINKSIRVMAKAIKQVMALRETDPIIISDTPNKPKPAPCLSPLPSDGSRHTHNSSGTASTTQTAGTNVDIFCSGKLLDEVKQTTQDILPPSKAQYKRDPKSINLPEMVKVQLKDYVTIIASMYTDNAFHNFEHASEVVKSSNAILSFISMSKEVDDLVDGPGSGVITDPWTHFALVFSALIHDVDHSGVPNAQLTKEKSIIADSYKGKSVAEQNSIEIAWNLLMEPCYKNLREVLFTTAEEVSRFRRLVVIFVMATDIADQELAKFRKQRAQEALACQESSTVAASGKATYIMETIMQAADVSHTMQPFDVYKKWNWKLYREMYTAFEKGRAEKDPSDTWYEGDIKFFDHYIIPLAKQLIKCGVMDESKVENLLNNAQENREEWAKHGKGIVEQYVTDIRRPKKERRLHQRRGSIGDSSMTSVGSALSDLTDYDDLSACSLLDNTFAKIPNKPRSLRSPLASKKTQGRDSSRSLRGRQGSSQSLGGRRGSSRSPGKKNRSSLSSPKRMKKSKKREKMIGPPPLFNGDEVEKANEATASKKEGKSSRQSMGEVRKGKSAARRKSELAPRRHSVDSPRKARSAKNKSNSSSAKKSRVGSRRHSADGARKGRSRQKSEMSPHTTKRRSRKSAVIAQMSNIASAPGEIVLPIRTNRPKKNTRSKSSGRADKDELFMFAQRFQAFKEARNTEARQRSRSASRATWSENSGNQIVA